MNKLVSIIVPVYNSKPFLLESINSIIHQTYDDLEILIIDDGSTDGSGRICDRFSKIDSRIRVFHHGTNRGLCSARNTGLNNMTGELVAFLDPDDAMLPNTIQVMVEQMNMSKADVVICDFSWHRTMNIMDCSDCCSEKVVDNRNEGKIINQKQACQRLFYGKINTAVWNKLYAKDVWEGVRFPDGHTIDGTFICFDIFSRVERVVIIRDKLFMHRVNPGSICTTSSI